MTFPLIIENSFKDECTRKEKLDVLNYEVITSNNHLITV